MAKKAHGFWLYCRLNMYAISAVEPKWIDRFWVHDDDCVLESTAPIFRMFGVKPPTESADLLYVRTDLPVGHRDKVTEWEWIE